MDAARRIGPASVHAARVRGLCRGMLLGGWGLRRWMLPGVSVLAKVEYFNPGGSVKDRNARWTVPGESGLRRWTVPC
ncbi:hypothetical protein GCM10010234_31400 [Streptomyces hawaiiensis]